MPAVDFVLSAMRVATRGAFDRPLAPYLTRRFATRVLGGVAIVAFLGVGSVAALHYWQVERFVQSTNDAYVQADSTIVAPKVSGYIAALLVDDNQPVHAGDVLAHIDDRDFQAALDEATANVAAATASIANLDAQVVAQGSVINEANAAVADAKASLGLAQRNDARRQKMAQVGYGSEEQADNASTDAQEKLATFQRLQAAADAARQQLAVLTAQRQLTQAQLAHAEAAQWQANLNLSYAAIVAPVDGTVAARTVRQGQYVQAGTQLMALVPLRRVYVVANFKETQLTHLRPGQAARIAVDTFPGDTINGQVESLAPASGLEFSLLPPDNATGNFTKIVQRIPVKITFAPDDPLLGKLRAGMSVNVSVDTRVDPVAVAHPGRR